MRMMLRWGALAPLLLMSGLPGLADEPNPPGDVQPPPASAAPASSAATPAPDAVTPVPRAPDPKAIHLKVMTYNIRGGKGGAKDGHAMADLEPVAKIIAREAPDLVALEEVDRLRKRSQETDQAEWLGKRLGLMPAFEWAFQLDPKPPGREQYGVAVLSRLPLAPPQRHFLYKPDYRTTRPELADYFSEQRILLQTTITVRGVTLHFFCTHLGLTPDQLEKQTQEIVEIASKVKGPVIIAGDFNGKPQDRPMAPLYAAFREVQADYGVNAKDQKSFPVGTESRVAIDHIFVSPEFRVLKAEVVRDETLASDHNPVVAELELQ